jgi:hypothetical protein
LPEAGIAELRPSRSIALLAVVLGWLGLSVGPIVTSRIHGVSCTVADHPGCGGWYERRDDLSSR